MNTYMLITNLGQIEVDVVQAETEDEALHKLANLTDWLDPDGPDDVQLATLLDTLGPAPSQAQFVCLTPDQVQKGVTIVNGRIK